MAPMVPKALAVVVMVLELLSNNHEAAAAGRSGALSQEELEDLELERQLKMLNKPPIKTIQIEEGEIFDCIDIHKQPTLDHPKLQNHQIQMRPSSYPKGLHRKTYSDEFHLERIATIKPIDCPQGTIPIRRTTKEDLKRGQPFLQFSNRTSISPSAGPPFDKVHQAVHQQTSKDRFYGLNGALNVANPVVGNDQFSSAMLWIIGDHPTGHLQSLIAGWAVSPQLYNDTKTRFFVYSNPDDNVQGCFNFLCKSFVQVSKTYGIGSELHPISVYGGQQYEYPLTIFQDPATGDWWLRDPSYMHDIGYWPKNLFGGLEAPKVAWGGLAREGPDGKSPEMGNGRFPGTDYQRACYVKDLHVIYLDALSLFLKPTDEVSLEPPKNAFMDYSDNKGLYDVVHDGGEPVLKFLFGGPGGYGH